MLLEKRCLCLQLACARGLSCSMHITAAHDSFHAKSQGCFCGCHSMQKLSTLGGLPGMRNMKHMGTAMQTNWTPLLLRGFTQVHNSTPTCCAGPAQRCCIH